jgi:hypothetical protein
MKYAIGFFLFVFLSGFHPDNFIGRKTILKTEWLGNYVNDEGVSLVVKDQTLLDITFEIVNKGTECQESFHGKGLLTSATNASYNDKDNLFNIGLIRRKDGKIEVTERGFVHPVNCPGFSGIYKPSN